MTNATLMKKSDAENPHYTKAVLVLVALVSLTSSAWNASTAWQWNDSARAGIYESAQTAQATNVETFGPRINLVRAGGAVDVETLEARVAAPVSLMGLVFEKLGFALFIR